MVIHWSKSTINKGIEMEQSIVGLAKGSLLIITMLLTGCATTGNNPADPWEGWNRKIYDINNTNIF